MPKFIKNESIWVLVFTIAYIISGYSDNETVWQVVVAVSAYIGGSALKDFGTNVYETLKKIDAILDRSGIHWEEILEDAIKKISKEKSAR